MSNIKLCIYNYDNVPTIDVLIYLAPIVQNIFFEQSLVYDLNTFYIEIILKYFKTK